MAKQKKESLALPSEKTQSTTSSQEQITTETSKSQGRGGKRDGAGRKSGATIERDKLTLHNIIYHTNLTELNSQQDKHIAPLAETTAAKDWWAVLYPDSEFTPSDWLEQVKSWLIPVHISPIHKDDCNADGEIKKPHYHIILRYPEKQTPLYVAKQFAEIGAIIENKPIKNIVGATRYLIHKDNPEKAQYSIDDVQSFNGADYLADISSTTDEYSLMHEIEDFIYEYRDAFNCYASLSRYLGRHNQLWYRVLVNHSFHFTALFKTKKYDTLTDEEILNRMGAIDGARYRSESAENEEEDEYVFDEKVEKPIPPKPKNQGINDECFEDLLHKDWKK